MRREKRARGASVVSIMLILSFLAPQMLFAAFPLTVSPAVIDGEAKAREILRYKLTITNNTKQMLTLYPWARDVDELGEDTKTQDLDPTKSLLSWLQFSRAEIVIRAGETVELPVLVQVNLRANPGIYHAVLFVSDGPNRAEAEANRDRMTSMMVNIRVLDDANERLQLGVFTSNKNLFMGGDASFGYRLENTGNRGIVPTGKIRIFDRKGEEVAVVPVNDGHAKIEPDMKQQLASVWASGDHFGKYKAMLDVSYGKSGTIQDTVFFWVLPWKKLLSFFLTLAIISTLLALLLHSYIASGGKKLVPVRARFARVDEIAEEENEAPTQKSIGTFTRLKDSLRKKSKVFEKEVVAPKESYTDLLKELPAPPPRRTRYSVTHSPETTERVHLSPRTKKQSVDPAHIVRL